MKYLKYGGINILKSFVYVTTNGGNQTFGFIRMELKERMVIDVLISIYILES
jgi:hypothetical protein